MLPIIVGALVLSVIHALIPNHWIPLVAIGEAEEWGRNETLSFTAIVGFSHTSSTILIGIAVGLLGYSLSQHHLLVTKLIAPLLLLAIGFIYLILHFKGEEHSHGEDKNINYKSKWTIVGSLSVALFFSPCLEIEAYYFTAGTFGWSAILLISLIYLIVTVSGMVLMVALARHGMKRFDLHFLEHKEKLITGLILIIVGIATYLNPI